MGLLYWCIFYDCRFFCCCILPKFWYNIYGWTKWTQIIQLFHIWQHWEILLELRCWPLHSIFFMPSEIGIPTWEIRPRIWLLTNKFVCVFWSSDQPPPPASQERSSRSQKKLRKDTHGNLFVSSSHHQWSFMLFCNAKELLYCTWLYVLC